MIALINIDEIDEGTSKGIEIDNFYMFAVKKDGEVFLYWNRCPHLGTPLEWEEDKFLDGDAALIICSTHGALFEIESGHCLAGPCKDKHLQAIPFTLDNDMLMVEESALQASSPAL